MPSGEVNDDFFTALEFFPTILSAVGQVVPDSLKLDGFNMLPNLNGKGTKREEMFWEFRGNFAAHIGNWKWLSSAQGDGLFDLENDISEQHDLSRERPEVVKMMAEKFKNWQLEMEQSPGRGAFKDF